SKGSHSRRRSAFTLVELLVVVGVIGVLISIIMPTVGHAREAARRTNCLSNLHQVQQSVIAYALANNDHAPIGHRSVSKQFNSMVYSTTAGGKWVLFGLFWR